LERTDITLDRAKLRTINLTISPTWRLRCKRPRCMPPKSLSKHYIHIATTYRKAYSCRRYLNDESTPDIIKEMISHNNTQLHHLYLKHPSWYLHRYAIEPMYLRLPPFHVYVTTNSTTRLLHREGGPMFLALAQAQYERMKFFFPREVRDLVWAQVCDEDTIEDSLVYMRNTINAPCQTCIKPEDLNCPYHYVSHSLCVRSWLDRRWRQN